MGEKYIKLKKNVMSKKMNKIDGGKVVLYKKGFEVQLRQETVWLSQKEISDLFNAERSVITKHIRNIFKTKELSKSSVCAKFAHTAKDGKAYQTQFYNLDLIISVGYRVNSKRGTEFRIWASKILKKHLVDGYTINEKRLKKQEQKYLELKNAVKLIGNITQTDGLSVEAKGLAQVISEYTHALDILDDFDHQRLVVPGGTKKLKYRLTYEKAKKIIESMNAKFKNSSLAGREKDKSFKSSIGAIYQTYAGKDVYETVENKAAHLLYFVTKNHSFIDGNKRIAAALFICFLKGNGILLKKDGSKGIDDNALVALILMIAVSKPSEKDVMVKVILNLLA